MENEKPYTRNKSSHQRCSMKKNVLTNSIKFTGKHLRQSLFFNKVAGNITTVPKHAVNELEKIQKTFFME